MIRKKFKKGWGLITSIVILGIFAVSYTTFCDSLTIDVEAANDDVIGVSFISVIKDVDAKLGVNTLISEDSQTIMVTLSNLEKFDNELKLKATIINNGNKEITFTKIAINRKLDSRVKVKVENVKGEVMQPAAVRTVDIIISGNFKNTTIEDVFEFSATLNYE